MNHPHGYQSGNRQSMVNQVIFLLLCTIAFACGSKQQTESVAENNNEGTNGSSEVTVDWYSIPDAGLLSIERKNANSIDFMLIVGAGERCTGETSGTATQQTDGSFIYGNADCSITFKPTSNGITLEESGDLCEHGAHCSFGGDYAKVVSEKISPANGDLMSWMRRNTSDFSCLLEKEYGYKSEKYPCGQTQAVNYDPKESNWYEGPEFPREKIKALHPLVKDVSVQFEHGDLYSLTVTLETKVTFQSVQRIFSLPDPFDGYGNEKYSNVMSLTFNDDNGPTEKPQFSVNPVFITSVTLIGFEHMGAGDIESESGAESILETIVTYEYRENGDAYTLVDEGGPGPYEFTCTGIASVKTSSDLAAQGSASYTVDKLTDMDESTTWAEGKDGLGEGEWIEFTLTDAYKKWGYTDRDFVSKAIHGAFVIQTGFAKSPRLWKKNSRPVKLKCYLNGEPLSIIQLKDTPDFQTFGIFPEGAADVKMKEGDVIRFEILEVIKGTADEDACISEFHLEGSCG